MFGNTERELRKKTTIVNPLDYLNIFEHHGTVINVGSKPVPIVHDWKSTVGKVIKVPSQWHFKFSKAKRFILLKKGSSVLLQGEDRYLSEMSVLKSILKKSQNIQNFNPAVIPKGVPLSAAKVKDIKNLLEKHVGEKWVNNEDLKYFFNVITQQVVNVQTDDPADEQSIFCEPVMDDELENDDVLSFV